MKYRCYVASPLACAQAASRLSKMLTENPDIEVVSTWHEGNDTSDPADTFDRLDVLQTNLADLDRSDCVVCYIPFGIGKTTYGEAAWAIKDGKPVVWCVAQQASRSIFDAHPLSYIVDDETEVAGTVRRALSNCEETVR